MVVMDREYYVNKSNSLLAQPAYRPIPKDTTNKIKAKLITILRKFKNETGLDNNTYKYMYPVGCSAIKFLWASQDPQAGHPLRLYCPAEDWSLIEWPRYLPKT